MAIGDGRPCNSISIDADFGTRADLEIGIKVVFSGGVNTLLKIFHRAIAHLYIILGRDINAFTAAGPGAVDGEAYEVQGDIIVIDCDGSVAAAVIQIAFQVIEALAGDGKREAGDGSAHPAGDDDVRTPIGPGRRGQNQAQQRSHQ